MTLSPLLDLAIRLFMANIFFKSGKLKFDSYMNGQWDDVVTAFSDYHPIPGVPAELAAIGGTVGELALPIMLALGLFTRVGAAGLLVMTLTIQYLVPAEYEVANADHYMWMLLLAVPMLKGGGMLSVDFLFGKFGKKFFCKKHA
ncbi:MAG: DoxX family protein [Alphaproteobacteria bacterium]